MFNKALKQTLEIFKTNDPTSSKHHEAVRTMQYKFVEPVYHIIRKRQHVPPYFKQFTYDAVTDKWYMEFLTIPEPIEFNPLRYKAKYIVQNIERQYIQKKEL